MSREHHRYWKLLGQLAVPCPDLMEWALHFQCCQRRVAETRIGPMCVSTVFLGLNHNIGPGEPLIFETLIFRGGVGHECWRSSSWQQAETDHARAVELVRKEIKERAQ